MCRRLRIATGSLQSSNKLAAPGVFKTQTVFGALKKAVLPKLSTFLSDNTKNSTKCSLMFYISRSYRILLLYIKIIVFVYSCLVWSFQC